MSAAILRRVLFSLAPVELAMVALMAAGVSLPTPLRLAVVTLLIATVLAELTIWTVDFFRNRRLGSTVAESAKNAAHHIIGERLWRFIASEFGLISSLVRLIARRPKVPAGSTVFTYHRQSSPVVWMMVAFLVIELVVLHLVTPWDAVRLVALILGIYGLLWVVGYVAGFAMHPHLLTEPDLIIRRGPTLAIVLPLDTIERVEAKDRDLPGWRSIRSRASSRSGDEPSLHIVQSGRTNLDLELREAIDCHPIDGGEAIRRISIWADDAEGLMRRLRYHHSTR